MAFFKLVPGEYRGEDSIKHVLKYILNEAKNPNAVHNVYGTSDSDIENIIFHFIKVQELYRKTNYRRILHLIVSFPYDSSYTPADYKKIGNQIAAYYSGHQVIFALHEKDKCNGIKQPHIHIALNPINYETGKRIRYNKKLLKDFHNYLKTICSDSSLKRIE